MPKKITFSGCRLIGFSRNAKKGGMARFRSLVNGHVCEQMEWPAPDERLTSADPDGTLDGRIAELVPKDKELRQWSLTLDIQKVHSFHIIRCEAEGKKAKGYRHELQFDVAFGDPLGCAKLETFILTAGDCKCGLVISYDPAVVQEEMPLAEVQATEEQRQAAMEVN